MARKGIDLTGQRFGRWVVIKEVEQKKYARFWECICDCGNEKVVNQSTLIRGDSKSCGCLARELTSARNSKDYTGKKSGRLTAIRDTGKRRGNAIWLFLCECGNEIEVCANDVFSGNTKSCGCLVREVSSAHIKKVVNESEKLKKFHEWDTQEKGTKITTLRPDRFRKDNTSGTTGVYWHKQAKKWKSEIHFKGEKKGLGLFKNKQDAINARKEAEEKYFKPILEKYAKK